MPEFLGWLLMVGVLGSPIIFAAAVLWLLWKSAF